MASGGALGGLGCSPAGAAVGESLSACLFPTDVQDVLTAIGYGGLILFMFMMGLELDWEALRSRSHEVVTIAPGSALLAVALGAATALVLYGPALVPGWGTGGQPSKVAFGPVLRRVAHRSRRSDPSSHSARARHARQQAGVADW